MHVGILGIGTYLLRKMKAADLALATGIPEDVIAEKFGVREKAVAGAEDSTADMGYKAALVAIERRVSRPRRSTSYLVRGPAQGYPCWLAGLNVAHRLGPTGPGASTWRRCAAP